LTLLLLFGPGCRSAELVDTKKKGKDIACSAVIDPKADDDDDGDSGADADEDSTPDDDDALSMMKPERRRFDAFCYEDVHLLVMRNSYWRTAGHACYGD